MPNVSLSTIRQALITNLQAVTEIKVVATGITESIEKFPAARVSLLGISDVLQDTVTQYRTYRFAVDIIYPLVIQGISKATSEATIDDAIDAVMDKLNNEWDAANIEYSLVESGTTLIEEGSRGPQYMFRIVWSAKTLITIS